MPSKSCLIFTEGGQDKKFVRKLTTTEKFQWYVKDEWKIKYDNGFGESPEEILKKCKKVMERGDFDLVICVIDLDVVKDTNQDWETARSRLEDKYNEDINIFWQEDNLEDEQRKVLNKPNMTKRNINKYAINNIERFINSEYWNKLKELFINHES